MPTTAHFGVFGLPLLLITFGILVWTIRSKSCLNMILSFSVFATICGLVWDVTDCLNVNTNPQSTCSLSNPLSMLFYIPVAIGSLTISVVGSTYIGIQISKYIDRKRSKGDKTANKNQTPFTD